jgi:hypothetical protein
MLGLGVDASIGHVNAARGEHPAGRRRGQNGRAIDAAIEDTAGFVESLERDDVVGHGGSMPPQVRSGRPGHSVAKPMQPGGLGEHRYG